ncbi:MAG: CarD family transcriptional regulator, partial [Nitrospirota bacterium]
MPAASQSTAYWDQILRPVLDALRHNQGRPCLTGLHGSTTAFVLTLLARGPVGAGGASGTRPAGDGPLPAQMNKSWLIVTASDESAERLYDDLRFFHAMLNLSEDALALFPEWETLPYEATPPHVELIARRMRTLHRLAERSRTVLVTSVPALVQRLLPLSVFSEACLRIRPGETLERETLASRLLRLGYRRGSVVEIPGEFSIRGGIVDIYSTAHQDPLRVELLGDTVESVRLFDTATQKSTAKLDHAWLLPARELIYPETRTDGPDGRAPLPPDAEWRGPEIYPIMETLLDYFTDPPVLVLDQPQRLAKKAKEFWDEAEEAYLRHGGTSEGGPYPTPDRLYLPWNAILERAQPWPCLATEPLASLDASWHPAVAFPAQSPTGVGLARRGTPFTDTLATLDRLRDTGTVLLVARSRGQVDRLLALFAEHDLPAAGWQPQEWVTLASSSSQKPPFYLLHGDLSAGFVAAEGRLSVITEEELFAKGMRHRPPPKSKTATFLSSLDDLNAGDYVVHVQHGIGRYQGLRRLTVQGFESDYLVLE